LSLSIDARRRLLGVAGVVVVLVGWEAAARLGVINSLLLGSPTAIGSAAVSEVRSGAIWGHLGISALEFVLGIGLSAVVGIGIGLLAGWFRRVDYLVDPWLTILYSTPSVALAPLIIIAFGIELSAKVFIVFLFAVFPIAVNTIAGVHATAGRYLRVARSFSAPQWTVLRTIILPGALPYIATGMRVAGGRALVGIVVAELIAGNAGIGYLLNVAGATLKTGTLFLLVIILGLAGMAYAALLGRLEDRLERWRPARS
jgi:NitT/TauT family transport system permease protein